MKFKKEKLHALLYFVFFLLYDLLNGRVYPKTWFRFHLI